MTRQEFIERHRVQIYGGWPTDDAEITDELVNSYMSDAIGLAAKTCWKESIQIDGIAYLNNSFYTTFSGIAINTDNTDNLCYQFELPQIPFGLGKNEGLAKIQFKDSNGFVSQNAIPLSMNQIGYADRQRPIPGKIIYWYEGNIVRLKTPLIMTEYTAIVRMASGGNSSDLDSELNVPADYFPVIVDYIQKQLMIERAIVPDLSNDGTDIGTSIK
jgi:hypothetical protein